MDSTVGHILKTWRKKRKYSQMTLAMELDISSKHISFIETGRSYASKEMILKIGEFLEIPKQEVNRALSSSGYSQIYTELPLSHEDMKPVADAIDKMIENHMPYPALVLDSNLDIVKANASAIKLMEDLGFSDHSNIIEILISGEHVTSKLINCPEVAAAFLTRLRQEIAISGDKSSHLHILEKRLNACLPQNEEDIGVYEKQVVVPTKLQLPGYVLSLFSVFAQLSTVQDVTATEFKVELMFPADEKTKEFYNSL